MPQRRPRRPLLHVAGFPPRSRATAHAARHARPHAAAVLPPGPVGADQAHLLLRAGAVPDGGRHALSHRRPAARGASRRRCCRSSARSLVPVQMWAGRRRLPAWPAVGADQRARSRAPRLRNRPSGRHAPSSSRPRTGACARCSTCGPLLPCVRRRPRCCTRRPTPTRARSSSTAGRHRAWSLARR